jgi:Secretion system C-terminal sorting domain
MKITIAIAFFFVIHTSQYVYAQSNPMKDLTIGNTWVYKVDEYSRILPYLSITTEIKSSSVTYTEIVQKDSIIGKNKYSLIHNSLNGTDRWERVDSNGIWLWTTSGTSEVASFQWQIARDFRPGFQYSGFDCSNGTGVLCNFSIGSNSFLESIDSFTNSRKVQLTSIFAQSIGVTKRDCFLESDFGVAQLTLLDDVTARGSVRVSVLPGILFSRYITKNHVLLGGRIKNKVFGSLVTDLRLAVPENVALQSNSITFIPLSIVGGSASTTIIRGASIKLSFNKTLLQPIISQNRRLGQTEVIDNQINGNTRILTLRLPEVVDSLTVVAQLPFVASPTLNVSASTLELSDYEQNTVGLSGIAVTDSKLKTSQASIPLSYLSIDTANVQIIGEIVKIPVKCTGINILKKFGFFEFISNIDIAQSFIAQGSLGANAVEFLDNGVKMNRVPIKMITKQDSDTAIGYATFLLAKKDIELSTIVRPSLFTANSISLPFAVNATSSNIRVQSKPFAKLTLTPSIVLPLLTKFISISPNPISSTGEIIFEQNQIGTCKLLLYNSLNQKVLTLFDGTTTPGQKTVSFNVTQLTNGIYSCQLQSETGTDFRTIIVQK